MSPCRERHVAQHAREQQHEHELVQELAKEAHEGGRLRGLRQRVRSVRGEPEGGLLTAQALALPWTEGNPAVFSPRQSALYAAVAAAAAAVASPRAQSIYGRRWESKVGVATEDAGPYRVCPRRCACRAGPRARAGPAGARRRRTLSLWLQSQNEEEVRWLRQGRSPRRRRRRRRGAWRQAGSPWWSRPRLWAGCGVRREVGQQG